MVRDASVIDSDMMLTDHRLTTMTIRLKRPEDSSNVLKKIR